MIKAELIKRSPLRILEKSMGGGLGKGNIGVLASRKGVGKTACLVHISTYSLFQDKPVIHISYSSRVDYIISRYEEIFKEIAKKRELGSAIDVHDQIIRNRIIMNFKQDGQKIEQVLNSVEALIEHGNFPAEMIIVDGYNFEHSTPEDFAQFRTFAGRIGAEIWFSASLKGDGPLFDAEGFPIVLKDYAKKIDVLITMAFKEKHVRLYMVKNHNKLETGELPLQFDPKTMLIAK